MKAQRPFQQLRSIVVAAVLSGLAVPGMARPVKTWNHQELFQSADAVLVLAVLDIDRAQEKPATFGIADTYQAYRTRCRVLERWCPEGMGEQMVAGRVAYWDSPAAMWLVLGVVAIGSCLVALGMRDWLTRGLKESVK